MQVIGNNPAISGCYLLISTQSADSVFYGTSKYSVRVPFFNFSMWFRISLVINMEREYLSMNCESFTVHLLVNLNRINYFSCCIYKNILPTKKEKPSIFMHYT